MTMRGPASAWLLASVLWGAGVACAQQPQDEEALPPPVLDIQAPQAWETASAWERGLASWYSHRFEGKRTASGEAYRSHVFSAAHRSLPLGSLVTVRNPGNQAEVVVRINDRGPHHPKRDIDLSLAAAQALDILHKGVATIEWQLAPSDAAPTPPMPSVKAFKQPPHTRKARSKAVRPSRTQRR